MIVDTNVLSSVFSRDKQRQAIARDFLAKLGLIKTSVIVIYQIEYGLARHNSQKSLAKFQLRSNVAIINPFKTA